MAIPISSQHRPIHWFGWLVTLVILGGLSYVAYQVYSSPAELIEKTTGSSSQDPLSAIAEIEFNPSLVANDTVFNALRPYVDQITVGERGRPNPFARF